MRILFVSWRDLAHPQAGGSERLVDALARGCLERGHETALICGGPVGKRPYPAIDAGGTYTQYLRAPLLYAGRFRGWDLLVDVQNGIPFFSPLWRRGPVVCLVHHVHTAQWSQHFSRGVAAFGATLERRAMPAIYRRALFIAVSESTARGLADIGVSAARVRLVPNPSDVADTPTKAEAKEPLFVAVGRAVAHKRLDLLLGAWERVRPQTGGRLIVVGDGPELERLRSMAGEGVELLGRVGEAEKLDLMSRAWLLVHAAHHEGWGMVIMEAAAVGTPAIGFDTDGVRDAVVDGETGVLACSEEEFDRAWVELAASPSARARLGANARARAATFDVTTTVDRFLAVAAEAIA